jgi:hypothetical protein
MTETKNGVVVFLDALGVSDYDQDKCRDFIDKKYKIRNRLEEATTKWKMRIQKDLKKTLLEPNIATFQDSIILWWPKQEENSLHFFCGACDIVKAILHLAFEERIFLRGAISVGEYIYDDSPTNVTIIGQAVTDAYKHHDITDWIGVIQTPTFEREYHSLLESIAKKKGLHPEQVIEHWEMEYVLCNIPLHKEKNKFETLSRKKFFAVSWPQLTYQIEENWNDNPYIQILLDESIRPENAKYKSKYLNSLEFAKWYKKSGKYYPNPDK